jgi:hypothetical protein
MALGLAAFSGLRQPQAGAASLDRWYVILVVCWLFVPVSVTVVASFIQPLFVARYLISCLPPFLLAVAAGIVSVRFRWLQFALLFAISFVTLWGTLKYNRGDFPAIEREDWREATSYVLSHARSGDGIFFFLNVSRIPFEYYSSRLTKDGSIPHLVYISGNSALMRQDFEFVPMRELVSNVRPAPNRLWIVLNHDGSADGTADRTSQEVQQLVSNGRNQVEEEKFPGVVVKLFSRP